MKHEHFHAEVRMLRLQLQEEHENYKRSLAEHKEFQHLKNIKQRIKSLNVSLQLIETANTTASRSI